MKVTCVHGYFTFDEDHPGEISSLVRLTGMSIQLENGRFIFSALAGAPDFTIQGGKFLGVPATATFEGTPGEVMRKNRLVYDFSRNLIVPIASVARQIKLSDAGSYIFTNGMIVPGSITEDGKRVTDYSAYYRSDRRWRFTEIGYE